MHVCVHVCVHVCMHVCMCVGVGGWGGGGGGEVGLQRFTQNFNGASAKRSLLAAYIYIPLTDLAK